MKTRENPADLARRQFLWQALSGGVLLSSLGWHQQAMASRFGRRRMPPPRQEQNSIHAMQGPVWINGRTADSNTRITASDRVEVGPGGKLIYAVGESAFILRERSLLEMSGKDLLVNGIRLISGAVLGVFGKRKQPLVLRTTTATIGIRGTALYTRSHPDKTYACTCYGRVLIQSRSNPDEQEEVVSSHHDAPRWIMAGDGSGPSILPAPVIDHSDLELEMLEALCGREPPFSRRGRKGGGRRY